MTRPLTKTQTEIDYEAVPPVTERLAQQVPIKRALYHSNSLQQFKQHLTDCSMNPGKYYFVILHQKGGDSIRYILHSTAAKIEDSQFDVWEKCRDDIKKNKKFTKTMATMDPNKEQLFLDKHCGWRPITGHSSLLSEAEFKLYDSKNHQFQVTFAGNFIINDKKTIKKKPTKKKKIPQEEKDANCMSSYDNDTGHFKAKQQHGPSVAKYWSFTGKPMWVNHKGEFEDDDIGLFQDDGLPPLDHQMLVMDVPQMDGMPPPMVGFAQGVEMPPPMVGFGQGVEMPPPMVGFGQGAKAEVGYDNYKSISSEYLNGNGYYEPDIGHGYLINSEYQYGYYDSSLTGILIVAGIDILLAIILICLSLLICGSILTAIYIYKIKKNKDGQIYRTISRDIESN